MKRTGIFYHPVCGEKAYFSLAMSVKEGFESLQKENLFAEPNVTLFQSEPVSEELILKVHTMEMVERVKRSGYYETSLYSVGGSLGALQKVLSEEIDNALVFMGAGGHHSGRDYFGGGCFFNSEAIPIEYARQRLGIRRFAIVDTDTHHANGTIDIFKDDEDLLYICFCGGYSLGLGSGMESKTKLCFAHGASDEEEVENVKREVPARIEEFRPELIYWMFGMDTHKDSYGTRKLTKQCYPKLAEVIKGTADEICHGKLVVVNGCNAPAHVTQYVMPRVVDCLAELNKYT
jgi:acetoin utilization deacetylase AcuC-like enzyme